MGKGMISDVKSENPLAENSSYGARFLGANTVAPAIAPMTEKMMNRIANSRMTIVNNVANPFGEVSISATCLAFGSGLFSTDRSSAAFISCRNGGPNSGRVIATRNTTRKTANATIPLNIPSRNAIEGVTAVRVRLR